MRLKALRDGRHNQFSVHPRQVVLDQESTQEVRADAFLRALPEEDKDTWRADPLPRPELQAHSLHSGTDTERVLRALEFGRPLSRPAHRQHHPAPGPLEIEEREGAVGRTPPLRSGAMARVGRKLHRLRQEVVHVAPAPIGHVKAQSILPAGPNRQVQRADILQDRSVFPAGILEPQNPVKAGEALKGARLDPHTQPPAGLVP